MVTSCCVFGERGAKSGPGDERVDDKAGACHHDFLVDMRPRVKGGVFIDGPIRAVYADIGVAADWISQCDKFKRERRHAISEDCGVFANFLLDICGCRVRVSPKSEVSYRQI